MYTEMRVWSWRSLSRESLLNEMGSAAAKDMMNVALEEYQSGKEWQY